MIKQKKQPFPETVTLSLPRKQQMYIDNLTKCTINQIPVASPQQLPQEHQKIIIYFQHKFLQVK